MTRSTTRHVGNAISICGSHRSGTSMVTRMLNVCGLDLGPKSELMPPSHDNPDGFWENTRFVELNDRLLNEFGAGWDCPPDDDIDWSDSKLAYFRANASELIKSFPEASVWGWKDPRNSLLAGFWKEVIPAVKTVVLVRNPLDVAASLHARNSSTFALGLTLWLRYNERVLADTDPDDRLVTSYEAYFERPEQELRRLLEFTGLTASKKTIEIACETIVPDARHHTSSERLLLEANVDPTIIDVYSAMCEEAEWTRGAKLRSQVLTGAAVSNGSHEPTNGHQKTASGNGQTAAPFGSKKLVPIGQIEQIAGHPSPLGRELARMRSHFGKQAESLAAVADDLRRLVADRATLAEEVATSLKETRAELLTSLARHQRDAKQAVQRREVLALNARLDKLEEAVADSQRRQESRLDELAQVSRYLVHRMDQPEPESAEGRMRLRIASVIHAMTNVDSGVVLVGWEGRAIAELVTGRTIRYLPQTPEGEYVEKHPSSSEAALAQLEYLRANGAEYAIFPDETLWWQEVYNEFWSYLERRYPVLWKEEGTGIMYGLQHSTIRPARAWEAEIEAAVREFRARNDRDPAILDWSGGLLASAFPELAVFSPGVESPSLPYLPGSVDIVAVASDRSSAEARRVAASAVVAIDTVEDVPSVTVQWVTRPKKATTVTSASIVIPSWNGIDHTEKCVIALSETLPSGYDCEIVVVDDASTDDTPERLAALAKDEPRLKVVRNEQNSGFIMTCNRGLAESRGEYVIMLNNDTIPLAGWLEPLLGVFRHYPDAGASTGKLVFPDGTMQEAGSIIFADSRAANFGKWDEDTRHPLYNYVREVDYGSGALLAAHRSLWHELGGFDTVYRPIYCDDSDFCFKVRQLGLKVYYQPECVVVHVEGATSGRDESKGDKRYQALNRKKLAKRWRKELKRQPPYPDGFERPTLYDIVVREERDLPRKVSA